MTAALRTKKSDGICLIVEDSFFDQRMFVRTLRGIERDVPLLVAETLRAARLALARHPVRLAILDNALPDGLGIDLAQEMSEAPGLRHIPKILVSDWPSPFMFEKARQAGVISTMDKGGFGPSVLSTLFAPNKPRAS